MPTGVYERNRVLRSIDVNLTAARREIRQLELARAELLRRKRGRPRRQDRITRRVLSELNHGLRSVS